MNSPELKAPLSWKGKNTNAPYYRKAYGEWIRPLLDKMIESPEHEPTFNCIRLGYAPQTYRQKISQAWLYLIENEDREGKYITLRDSIKIDTNGNLITLKWKKSRKKQDSIMDSAEFISIDKEISWREELEAFVSYTEKDGEILERNDLNLTELDKNYVHNLIYNTDVFGIVSLDATGFKIIKSEIFAQKWRESIE